VSSKRRSGYTLFELGLVMAVLVVIGAISVPVLKPMLTSNNLQAASDMVHSRWSEMRTRAIADGRAYRFSIMENTGKFRIAPEDEECANCDCQPLVAEGTLPGEVRFQSSHAAPTGDNSNKSHGGAASGGWSRVVTFLADGTSHEDVQVGFGQSGSRPLMLRLRGATGAITAEEGHQ
jgi:type II secretory pathway pseudopilin PulG